MITNESSHVPPVEADILHAKATDESPLVSVEAPAAVPAAAEAIAERVWNQVLHPPEDSPVKQFGSSRRIVFLISDNELKLPEFEKNFARYGVEVYRAPAMEAEDFIRALFKSPKQEIKVLNVIREESDLYSYGHSERSSRAHLERVENRSYLKAYKITGSELTSKIYEHSTEGYIDHKRPAASSAKVFDWDNIFVVKESGHTYQELLAKGGKVSSRDMVIAEFLQDQLYYKAPVNLNFNPQQLARPVDFRCSVADFVNNNPLLNNAACRECRLDRLFTAVMNQGVFFRAPENRREKNYWLPGLNAGIPFVPKKDAIHEITYMAHDFGHFNIPDLIFTGEMSPELRRTYITYRMMSEALTIVLADMVFVDSLKRGGVDYDFSKRRIYPLFEALGIDLSDERTFLQNLKTLLKANVQYCLRGDDSQYRALLTARGADDSTLEAFKDKYMPFFVEDFRWTDRNWENMSQQAERQAKWWKSVAPLRDAAQLDLPTIGEFQASLDAAHGDLVDQVFERVFEERVASVFSSPPTLLPEETRLARAFSRYMMGQLGLFNEFDFAPQAATYRQVITDFVSDNALSIDHTRIDTVRGLYEQFVDSLQQKNFISGDDARTYKEVYPLFPPFYVFYDEGKEFYEDLSAISERLIG